MTGGSPRSSLALRLVEAFGWGVLCGAVVAIGGFVGQLVGERIYPQRYEQIRTPD